MCVKILTIKNTYNINTAVNAFNINFPENLEIIKGSHAFKRIKGEVSY